MDLLKDINLFLTKPKKAFAKRRKTSFKEALKYAAVLLLIYVMISSVVTIISLLFAPALVPAIAGYESLSIVAIILFMPLVYLFEFVALLFAGVWFHLFALIFGAREGVKQTIKTIIYGRTPYYLFAWVPIVGPLASVWSWVLYVFGFKKFQDMSTTRATLTVILGVVIPAILFLLLMVLAIGLLMSLAEASGTQLPADFTFPSLP